MAKADPLELRRRLEQCPPAGSRYRHYKGGEYVVIGSAILESTLEPVVLYRPVSGDGSTMWWVRPLSDWIAQVRSEGEEVLRFQRIE